MTSAPALRDQIPLQTAYWQNVSRDLAQSIPPPLKGSIAPQFAALAKLQEQGLVRHLGLSNATSAQVKAAREIAPVVCVQNQYNVVSRADDALIDELATQGIAHAPFFPLGGFTPLRSAELSAVATDLGATPMQTALAWLLRRAPNILYFRHVVAGAHARKLAAARLELAETAL